MAQLEKAKVFMIGGSQAVRIPAEFRFPGKEVYIRRDARNGDVILSESPGSLKRSWVRLISLAFLTSFCPPLNAHLPRHFRKDPNCDVALHA